MISVFPSASLFRSIFSSRHTRFHDDNEAFDEETGHQTLETVKEHSER